VLNDEIESFQKHAFALSEREKNNFQEAAECTLKKYRLVFLRGEYL